MTNYLIKGSRPYGGDAADILVKDGRIAAIGENLSTTSAEVSTRKSRVVVRQARSYCSVLPIFTAATAARAWAKPTRIPSPVRAST